MKSKKNARYLALVCFALLMLAGITAAQMWKSAGPAPRLGHSAIFDTTTFRMLVFGGQITSSNASPSVDLNDVWLLNSNLTWTSVNPTGTAPAPRLLHSAVYDEASNRMIIFGGAEGFSSPCANDVWALTNANGNGGPSAWIQISTSGGPPNPRAQHGAAYDPNTNTMIMYGGQDCFHTLFGDVWTLSNANGLGGTSTWTQLSPTGGGPGPREITGGVVYDATNNILIVFGGTFNSMVLNDVWVLSNANGQGGTPNWTQLSPSGTLPPARTGNSTIYDAASNHLTIFGGQSTSQVFGDVWVLSNANGQGGTPAWTELGPFSLFAENRYLHTAVYNQRTNNMIVFGGLTTFGGATTTNDLWALSHANGQ
jgi:hypothetical protein